MATSPQTERQIHAERAAQYLPPLLIAAERVATTVSQGVHGRRRVGQGETFWQFRRYEHGDSASMIDWRQSAKSQHVFVRETEWEAAQTAWLWADFSASMNYASSQNATTKADRASLLLLATTFLLMRAGERFSLLGTGMVPRTGRAAFDRIAEKMLQPPENDGNLPAFEPLPRYSQVLLFGDFLSPVEEVGALIAKFAARGASGQVIQILDPAEETLPFTGRIRFHGFEDEGQHLLGRTESVRSAYQSKLGVHRDQIREITRRAGWGFQSHRTDHSPESALLTLYTALAPRREGR